MPAPDRAQRWTVVALGVVVFAYAVQQTAVIPAIETIERAEHAGPAWSAWLLSGYLMVATVVTPALGRLADLHGEARVLGWSLAMFLGGSIGAAVLPGLPAIIVCRAAQGAGGAVLPLSYAVARRHLADDAVGRVIGVLTGVFGVGATVGFATGGVVAAALSWRLIFAAGAVVVAVGMVLVRRVVPRRDPVGEGTFDLLGGVLLAGASLGVLLALTLGQQDGWTSPMPGLLLAASAGCGAGWVRTELRHPQPLIDLRVLRDRAVLRVNVATVGLGWARFAGLLLVPELVQGPGHGRYGFGAGALVAGLVLVPDGVGTATGGPLAGRLAARVRPGLVFAGGLAILAGGAVMVAVGQGSVGAVVGAAAVLGFGGGIATQASSAVTTRDVPAEAAAASSALNSTVRRFAGGIGSQVSTVVLAASAAAGAHAAAGGFITAMALAATAALAGGTVVVGLGRARPGRVDRSAHA